MPVNYAKTAKAVGIGAAASLAVILLILCAACGILMMTSSIPTDSLPYLALAAAAAGTFVGGFIAAAITRSKGLIVGLLCGAAVFLCLLVIGLCSGAGQLGMLTIIRAVIALLFGALGGIKGVNRKEKLHIK